MKKIAIPLLKFKRTKKACGPKALAVVLKYFKHPIPLNKIIQNLGGMKKNSGVRAIHLAEYTKKFGFKVHCYSYNEKLSQGKAEIKKPNKNLIIKFLKKGLPVIIAVRTCLLRNTKFDKPGHYIVITKYQKDMFWYTDPVLKKEFTIKENDLIFAWYNNILDSSAYMLVLEPK
ncbi:C39 family peptidase [Patescibacteria group bacterium]|nr:C39 family peptidase [Patescibacteria group bacterium]